MVRNFRDALANEMKDPEFVTAWNELEPEFQIINAMLDARKEKNLTQKELSELTGIAQADISKLENGTANPSVKTLQRLANGMGMTVKIEFVPIAQ
ncbi:MAG: helix-turn-helix transcriptional regulator [Ruminococcus sp.]|nr:helix-turn-helix transcriptional regulator [Ruminococcus sp.]